MLSDKQVTEIALDIIGKHSDIVMDLSRWGAVQKMVEQAIRAGAEAVPRHTLPRKALADTLAGIQVIQSSGVLPDRIKAALVELRTHYNLFGWLSSEEILEAINKKEDNA